MVEVALRHCLPPVDLAIDCFSIITALLQGKKACCSPGRLGAHIWSRNWFHIEELGGVSYWEKGSRPKLPCGAPVPVTMRWVPAHLPEKALRQGLITAIDFYGNRSVDEMAKEAVEPYRVDHELIEGLAALQPLVKEVLAFVAAAPQEGKRNGVWPDVRTCPKAARRDTPWVKPCLPPRPHKCTSKLWQNRPNRNSPTTALNPFILNNLNEHN